MSEAPAGPVDVAILGAGPAGLMAALSLAGAGRSVVVLEQAPAPGGLAASFEVAGVRVDHGSHRLHRACPPRILATLRTLLGDDLQRRTRNGRIRMGDRWIAFPPRPLDAARHLPPAFVARAARDAALAPFRRPGADTFAEVVRAKLGPAMADDFYNPYVRKIWGTDPAELSGELARRRVSAGSAKDLLQRLRRPDPESGTFLYPRRGFGEIVERLADAAVAAGADLRLETFVEGFTAQGRVRTESGAVHARNVWSTIPVPGLCALVEPMAPAEVREAAQALDYRALVLCYIVLDVDRYTAFDAHYFPTPDVTASRVSEPKNYRDAHGADAAGRTVLCAELPCAPDDEIWTADADALAATTMRELARLGLPDLRPAHAEVRRVRRAYPVYRTGYERAFATLDEWVESQPNVLTFGRQGLFAHDNTHHALAMGLAAAECLRADGTLDRARWRAARRSFEDHVVED
jgi:protoporphyrinogen oxidase